MTILQDMYLLLLQEAHLVGVTPNHYPAIWAIAGEFADNLQLFTIATTTLEDMRRLTDVLAETAFASVRTLKKQQ